MDDDELTRRLGLNNRQQVNQAARRLADQGLVIRGAPVVGSKILNSLPTSSQCLASGREAFTEPPVTVVSEPSPPGELLTEDQVKAAVRDHFETAGFHVVVAWGRTRGVDVEAQHPDVRRWLVEAKGEVNSDQQQGSYFLGALGELLQRMDDSAATYALALPDNRRYRGLVNRLPGLAKERLGLVILWVTSVNQDVPTVRLEGVAT